MLEKPQLNLPQSWDIHKGISFKKQRIIAGNISSVAELCQNQHSFTLIKSIMNSEMELCCGIVANLFMERFEENYGFVKTHLYYSGTWMIPT